MLKPLLFLILLSCATACNYAQNVVLNPSANQPIAQPSGTTLAATSLNNVYAAPPCGITTPPTSCSGFDIGTWISNIFANPACSSACTVYIPSGHYYYANTIVFPARDTGNISLQCAPGTRLTWTGGAGDLFSVIGTGQSKIGHILDGCTFEGNSSATAGIHLRAVSGGKISNIISESMPNGDGILNEGANTIDYDSVTTVGNRNNVHNVGVTVSGVHYSANAIHFRGGAIDVAFQWGVFEDGSQAASVGPNQNNTYEGVVFEENGQTSNYGQAFLESCDQCAFTHDYFELSSTQKITSQIVVGDSAHHASNPIFIGNFFGTNGAPTTNEIFFYNTQGGVVAFNWDPSGSTKNLVNTNSTAYDLQVEYNFVCCGEKYTAGTGTFNLIWDRDGSGPTFAGNVTVANGTNTLYRCVTAGALPVGTMTTKPSECGSAVDTGLRVK